MCGHKTLPLYSHLSQFNVVRAVLDPFCDCCLIHAFVSEMVPSQELFRTKEFTHSFCLTWAACPAHLIILKLITQKEYLVQSTNHVVSPYAVFQSFSHFLPLRDILFCEHPVFTHHSPCSRNVRDQVSDPYKTAAQTGRQKDNEQNDSKQLPNLIPS